MNADLLLKHFERISDAPDALPRLRRFILNLAVRGRLAEQDENEEPAHKLMERLTSEHTCGKRAEAAQATDGSLEFQYVLPSGWCWTCLKVISRRIQYGFTASANPARMAVRLVRIIDIQKQRR